LSFIGKQEAGLLTALAATGSTVFTIDDAKAILGQDGAKAKKTAPPPLCQAVDRKD